MMGPASRARLYALRFDQTGAAIGSSVSAALGALALVLACRWKAGLDPSVGLFFARPARAAA